jgi:uncharacterized protein involved in outer membrane biogenesis
MRPLPVSRRVLVVLAIVLLLPPALLVGLLLVAESKWAEGWVSARVGGILHRQVMVEGIDIQLGRPLGIALDRLRISNPDWATTPQLVDATNLFAQVEILPLFKGQFVVPYLGARAATSGLERDGERATWRFGEGEQKESRLHLARLFLQDGTIAYRDKESRTALDFGVTGSLGENEAIEWTGKGTFKGEPAQGSGKILSLAPTPGLPIPLVAKATIGKAQIGVDGTIDPSLNDMDFKFTLAGSTLHQLQDLFGINLPDTPPFRLAGQLKRSGQEWNFTPFEGHVGDSDLRGSVKYVQGDPQVKEGKAGRKPFLQAKLQSKLLDFDDLGPLVGAPPKTGAGETASGEQKQRAAMVKASDKALPRMSFSTKRWAEMDADVFLDAKQVQRPKQLPLDTLSTHLVLKGGVLRLDPLNFGFAGGKIKSVVALDSTKKPTHGDMDIDIQGLQLAKLFPTSKTMADALGTLYGKAKLGGDGESMGELLATSDGRIGFAVDGGRVSALVVELIGLDLGEAAMVLGTKNAQVGLRCAAAALKVEDGVAEPETFIVDTTDTIVKVEGHVNLGTEKLQLVTRPEPKDPSIFALRSPIEIEGSIKKPKVKPRAGPIVARVAAAAALGAIAPPLAALAFVETGPGKDSDCGKVLAEAKAAGAVKKAS